MEELKAYGDRTSSFMSSYPGFESFANEVGRIQFVAGKKAWLGATEPLAPVERRVEVFKDFSLCAQENGKRAFLSPVSEKLSQELVHEGFYRQQVGVEPVFDLQEYFDWEMDPLDWFPRAKSLKRRGARVLEISGEEYLQDSFLQKLTQQWLSGKKSAPLQFLSQVKPDFESEKKRYFVVEYETQRLAFISAVPIFPLKAFYFADIINQRPIKTGLTELLLIESMRILYEEGLSEVRLGICPLAGLKSKESFWSRIFHWAFENSGRYYNFKSLYHFKAKFNPSRWDPLYLVSEKPLDWMGVRELLRAHLPQGFLKSFFPQVNFRSAFRDPHIAPFPQNFLEMLQRMKLTFTFSFFFLALHWLRSHTVFFEEVFLHSHFWPDHWSIQALFLGPLFHNHLFHLTGDTLTFMAFLGGVEILKGRRFAFLVMAFGLWLSNPLTVLVLSPLLERVSPEHFSHYLFIHDVGASNAVYAGAGALAGLLFHPFWVLLPMGLNALWYTYVAGKWLALHHVLALLMGYWLARRSYRQR